MAMMATRDAPPAFTSDEERWGAVVRRDRRADDTFRYAVRTTGVYCRPSCAARRARRENVRFYATGGEARGPASARAGAAARTSRRATPGAPRRWRRPAG